MIDVTNYDRCEFFRERRDSLQCNSPSREQHLEDTLAVPRGESLVLCDGALRTPQAVREALR